MVRRNWNAQIFVSPLLTSLARAAFLKPAGRRMSFLKQTGITGAYLSSLSHEWINGNGIELSHTHKKKDLNFSTDFCDELSTSVQEVGAANLYSQQVKPDD